MIKLIMNIFSVSMVLVSSVCFNFSYACDFSDKFDIDEAIQRLSEKEKDSIIYNESLKKNLEVSCTHIDELFRKSEGKKIGVVVGERHNTPSQSYLHILLLGYLKSLGIKNYLIEFSEKGYEKLNKCPSFTQEHPWYWAERKAQEAISCGMEIIPVDIREEQSNPQDQKGKLELVFHEGAENSFKSKILALRDHFIFIPGRYHTSFLYYDSELKENYNLLFLYSDFVESDIQTQSNDQDIKNCNHYVQERYNQHCDFLNLIKSKSSLGSDILYVPVMVNTQFNVEVVFALFINELINSDELLNYIKEKKRDETLDDDDKEMLGSLEQSLFEW